MKVGLVRHRVMVAVLCGAVMAGAPSAPAEEPSPEQLRRELEAMKRQVQQLQEQIKKQERAIEKLSAERKPAPAAAPATAEATTTDEERLKREVTENIMRRIQPSLTAANKTFPSQFNPAIGLIVDTVGSYTENQRGNFEMRSAELGLSASVDPFARAYAILNGTQDSFDVEEAAIVTTSLPYNLGVQGGRFFADFGRLSKFHDHDLPFVNRPVVLDEYVGGESQADGVQGSWLVPIGQYLTLTAGMYNKLGADNERVSNAVARDLSEFTYLGRAATFFSLTDANSVDLGLTLAGTPQVDIDLGQPRYLSDLDLTYRWIPLGASGYHGFIWGTEVLVNSENRPIGGFPADEAVAQEANLAAGLGMPRSLPVRNPTPYQLTALPQQEAAAPMVFERKNAVGLYSYAEYRFSRRLFAGFLFDWAESIDPGIGDTFAYSPYLTLWASEFQRFRLQYTRFEAPGDHENQFFLQWTVIIGSHVHSFRDR
jgi:hypothetical protein